MLRPIWPNLSMVFSLCSLCVVWYLDDSGMLTPTATESVLPWKRDDSNSAMSSGPVKQSEFPAWCSNKEYIAYSSPSATFLGKTNSFDWFDLCSSCFTENLIQSRWFRIRKQPSCKDQFCRSRFWSVHQTIFNFSNIFCLAMSVW